MSRKNRQHRHSVSHQNSNAMPLPQKIAHFAEKVWRETSMQAHGIKLQKLIEQALDQGNASALNRALRLVAPEVHPILEWAIQQVASTSSRLIAQDGPLTTHLFAIPMHLSFEDDFFPEEGCVYPAELIDHDWLIDSFKQAGLGAVDTDAALHAGLPFLYTREDLGKLSWTDVHGMCREFERMGLPGTQPYDSGESCDHATACPVPSDIRQEDGNEQLRFLVGACIVPAGRGLPFTREENAEKVARWCKSASEELGELILGKHTVFPPAEFYDAVANAEAKQHKQNLRRVVNEGVANASVAPEFISVYLSTHEWDDEEGLHAQIRIAGYENDMPGHLVFSYVWELETIPEMAEVADVIVETIARAGIKRIVTISDLLDAELCECCGEPMFRGPLNPAAEHNATILHSPGQIQ